MAEFLSDRFISPNPLRGCPRVQEGRGVNQIVGDDAEADQPSDSVGNVIPTAAETVSSLEHTDSPFAADSPALTAAEPPLAFVRPSGRGFPSLARQNHASDTACECRIFVLGGGKPAIGRGDIWGTAEDGDVTIERRCPQCHVRRSRRVRRSHRARPPWRAPYAGSTRPRARMTAPPAAQAPAAGREPGCGKWRRRSCRSI